MRCKNCDYRLWGATGRECPECGAPFVPSEFEFVPNSVRFCCPACGQDYYGTGPRGHLEPSAFQCVSCGQPIRMDEMTLFPTAGVEEEQTRVEQMPWLDRREIGLLRGWLRTIWMGMGSPSRLIGLTPKSSSAAQAFWFTTVTAALASVLGLLPLMAFPLMFIGGRGAAAGIGLVVAVALAAVWPAVLVLIWGGVAHAVLAISGDRDAGAPRTYQAMCYSAGPTIISAVPCLGIYLIPVAWIWWAVSAILMLRTAQRVSGVRAAAAVLTFPVLVLASTGLFIQTVVIPQISSARSTAAQTQFSMIAPALRSYALGNSGKGPTHAIELAVAGTISPFQFPSDHDLTKVPLGSGTLQDFVFGSLQQQTVLAKAAAAALPPNVVAHRLGDCVFTYHGMDFNTADPRLWTVILMPAKKGRGPQRVHVGLVDGTTSSFPISSLGQELANQNMVRASSGLPPLPDPVKMHAAPAVAAATMSAPARSSLPAEAAPGKE